MPSHRLCLLVAAVALLALTACQSAPPSAPPPAQPAKPTQAPQPQAAKPAQAAPTTAPAAKSGGSPPPKEITVILGSETLTMDPHKNSSGVPTSMLYSIFGYLGLTAPPDAAEKRPELAESWQWLNDKTLRYKLRQGIKFHNGEPFDATAVKFSIERIMNPATKSIWANGLAPIESINIVDPYTVDFVTKVPYAPLPIEVGRMWILPPKYSQEVGDQGLGLKPIGTGPYKFVEWVKGERVVLEANKEYWRGAPAIEKITWRAAPEASTRVAELLTGRADIVSDIPAEFQPQIESSGNRFVGIPSVRFLYVSMDGRAKPFDDKRVRQAVNHAIDVDAIVKGLMSGRAARINSPIGPGVLGHDSTIKGYEYNPDKAKQLLAEAGYPGGFSTKLHVGLGRFLKDKEITEAIVGQLAKVGIQVTPAMQEYGPFFNAFTGGSLSEMQLFSLTLNTGDPDMVLRYLDSKRLGKYYADPQLDEMIPAALTTTDAAKRVDMIKRIQARIMELAPWVSLMQFESDWGVSKRITVKPSANDLIFPLEITGP